MPENMNTLEQLTPVLRLAAREADKIRSLTETFITERLPGMSPEDIRRATSAAATMPNGESELALSGSILDYVRSMRTLTETLMRLHAGLVVIRREITGDRTNCGRLEAMGFRMWVSKTPDGELQCRGEHPITAESFTVRGGTPDDIEAAFGETLKALESKKSE